MGNASEYRAWLRTLVSDTRDFDEWKRTTGLSESSTEEELRSYLEGLQGEFAKIGFLGKDKITSEDTEIQKIEVSDHAVNGAADTLHSDVTITVRNGDGDPIPRGPFVIPRGIVGGISKVENAAKNSCAFTCADGSVGKLDLTENHSAGSNTVKTSVNVGLSVSGTAVSASVTGVSGGLTGLSLQATAMTLTADGLYYTADVWEQSSKFEAAGVSGADTNVNAPAKDGGTES